MSVVKELIRTEADGGISFGDYELAAKAVTEQQRVKARAKTAAQYKRNPFLTLPGTGSFFVVLFLLVFFIFAIPP